VADECEPPDAKTKIEHALERLLHRPVSIRFERVAEEAAPVVSSATLGPSRRDELAGDPMVQRVVELFEARPIQVEVEEEPPAAAST
jgi:hypothetical protein